MENLDEKKVNDENNRMTEWTDISETVEAVECNEVDEANERGGKKEAKKGGFWKGFVTGAAASMCGVILFCGSWLIGQQKSLKEAATKEEIGAAVLTDDATLRKLSQVQELIEDYYLNEVDEELLSDYLFKGVAVGLDDPYAAYYSSEELTSVLDSSRGEYFGIGAVISENQQTGELCIVQVYEDSPAEKGGLLPGDIVMALEDESATALGLSDLVMKIKASEEEFHLTVYRPDTEEELELTLKCDEIVVSHVEYEMLEDQIGYIQITEFTESAVTQFRDAVDDLNQQGMQKLIVDLRSNPGGLLTSVCDILEEVLPEGRIVYTEDRDGNGEEICADDTRSVTCEIAVLVDEYSASASEIFAGAIQDYELGPVIGTQTYGKGVVQKTYPLSDGSAFKMTVEKYYTAKGQDIEGNGITPDIIIEETDAKSEQTGSEMTETESEMAEIESEMTEVESEATEAEDPVLARAIEELKK